MELDFRNLHINFFLLTWPQRHGKWILKSMGVFVLMHTYMWVWDSWCLCNFIRRCGWRDSNDHKLICLLRFFGILQSFLKLDRMKILMFMLYNCVCAFSPSSWLGSCRYHKSMESRGGWKNWLLCRPWDCQIRVRGSKSLGCGGGGGGASFYHNPHARH